MSGMIAVGRPKKREGGNALSATLSIKALPEWYGWLKRYAKHKKVSIATAVDLALQKAAKDDGFDEPMPNRF